ncbi:MAG: A/G-specific adenine glycosylase [Bacteroidota bacterium]
MGFSDIIMDWYIINKRDLPWRNSYDAYKIWLSEVILQQTRVEQGMPYYEKFVANFPTVFDLAAAHEDTVLKLWQGLGYYSRARNLHHTAKIIVKEHQGIFPDSFEELIKLKGVGTYTAAAIASFAFDVAVPVVDGNVFRLLSRYFGIETAIDSHAGKKVFNELAKELMDQRNPAIYNQAIMEFGSLMCKPANPDCEICPLNQSCVALKTDAVNKLPYKAKTTAVRHRFFSYIYIRYKNRFVMMKRTSNDIWKNLYQFPMIETKKAMTPKKIMKDAIWTDLFKNEHYQIVNVSHEVLHKLSHQTIHAVFYEVTVEKALDLDNEYFWVSAKQHHQYAVPKLMENFLADK